MYSTNLVVLRGRITSEPRVRELPSGSTVTQLEITTSTDDGALSVPVALFDTETSCCKDHEVFVIGHIRRRFFRAGGTTQSRTEVVASQVLKATRQRTIERALAKAVELLSDTADPRPSK